MLSKSEQRGQSSERAVFSPSKEEKRCQTLKAKHSEAGEWVGIQGKRASREIWVKRQKVSTIVTQLQSPCRLDHVAATLNLSFPNSKVKVMAPIPIVLKKPNACEMLGTQLGAR